MSSRRWLLTASRHLYHLLLVGYPASFRHLYGPQMMQVFRDVNRDTYQQRGLLGLVGVWIHTLGDLIITAPREHMSELKAWKALWPTSAASHGAERSIVMALKAAEERHPFAERLAEVLDKEPSYYQLLVSTEPTRCMSDLIASLALDADPNRPKITLTLFQELGTNVLGKHMDRYPCISFSAVHRLLKRGVLSHLH